MPRLLTFPPAAWLKRVTLLALPFTVGFFLFFRVHDRPLAPYTIVDFELARTPARAEQMLRAWGAAGQSTAREALYIDFGFMPAYALFFSGLTLLAARAARNRVQTLGLWLVLAPFAAWLCDAVENFALLRVLAAPDNPSAAALALADGCATLKFALLLACLLYWPAAWLLSRLRR